MLEGGGGAGAREGYTALFGAYCEIVSVTLQFM